MQDGQDKPKKPNRATRKAMRQLESDNMEIYNGLEEMFGDLDEKMRHSCRLRWYYRWEKLKLDISEWWYKK